MKITDSNFNITWSGEGGFACIYITHTINACKNDNITDSAINYLCFRKHDSSSQEAIIHRLQKSIEQLESTNRTQEKVSMNLATTIFFHLLIKCHDTNERNWAITLSWEKLCKVIKAMVQLCPSLAKLGISAKCWNFSSTQNFL